MTKPQLEKLIKRIAEGPAFQARTLARKALAKLGKEKRPARTLRLHPHVAAAIPPDRRVKRKRKPSYLQPSYPLTSRDTE